MKKIVAGAAAVAVLTAAVPAQALPLSTGTSAYSSGAASGTGSLAASLSLSGSIGLLVAPLITPIVNLALNPLVAALTGSLNTTAASSIGSGSTRQVSTSATQAQYATAPSAFPTDPLPSPCAASGAQPCYSATGSTSLPAAPLVTSSVGAVNGYVEQVAASADATNPTFGRATVTSAAVNPLPALSGLTQPIVSTGVISSKSSCPNDGAAGSTKPKTAPTANVSASNVSSFGGKVTFAVANGQITSLVVNGIPYSSLATLPTVTVGALTVSPFGNSVLVTTPIDPTALLSALGLDPSAVLTLAALPVSGSVKLAVVLGPNATLTTTSASAWGLDIGVDLSGSMSFSLLGLVTATVTLPTGIGGGNFGNLADLRLAYSSCQSGTTAATRPRIVPPALV